jgi:hypothetical protein
VFFYRAFDADTSKSGFVRTKQEDARIWNRRGFGIFLSVNEFREGRRRIADCTRIRAWAIDMDEGGKDVQKRRLERAALVPSWVVETKRGYQAWWFAEDGRVETYRPLLCRLVHQFGADKNARDVARVLRAPGYYHLKNPQEPFLVRTAYGPKRARLYLQKQLARTFPPSPEEKKQHEVHRKERREYVAPNGDDFWERLYNCDQQLFLERLSGTGYVGGEQYTFRPVSGGKKHNIWVDGKGTSTWIDENGRSGSVSGGGPTVVQWLRWMGMSKHDCIRVAKELMGET